MPEGFDRRSSESRICGHSRVARRKRPHRAYGPASQFSSQANPRIQRLVAPYQPITRTVSSAGPPMARIARADGKHLYKSTDPTRPAPTSQSGDPPMFSDDNRPGRHCTVRAHGRGV